jgi:hypothetical protein
VTENHFNEKNIRLSNQDEVFEFLQKPAAALSGAVATFLGNPGEMVLIGGRIIQAALKKNLYEQFGHELSELIKKGKIKQDFFATHNQQSTLNEFLKFIDDNPPDEEIFRALKSIFFSSVDISASASDERKAHQFLQICKLLGSGEILLLRECWSMYQADPSQLKRLIAGENKPGMTSFEWLQLMSERLKLPSGLIEVHAARLLDLSLLDKAGANYVAANNCRLSSFGLEFCALITRH